MLERALASSRGPNSSQPLVALNAKRGDRSVERPSLLFSISQLLCVEQGMKTTDNTRSGMTLIELIIVMAIIAVLMAMILPAVQAVRESARRTQCANQFRQIGIAIENYVSTFGCYPPNSVTPWTVAVSSHLEQKQFFDRFDHARDAFSSPNNSALGLIPLRALNCPSDVLQRVAPFDWVATNAAGNVELFRVSTGPQVCRDGTSSTGLCVEVSSRKGLTQIEGPTLYLGVEDAVHSASGFNLLFADGRVRLMSISTSPEIMKAIGSPAGKEIVSID